MDEYAKAKEDKDAIKRKDFDSAKEYYEAKAKKQSELDAI
jgi:hypothetical protein